jgi:NADH-quinone oxidoreductase subunit M
MVNHGVATAALFLAAGYLVRRKGTASISAITGVEKTAPVLAGVFLVAGLAVLGLPGLSQFVSEIMVIIAAFQHDWWVGAIAVTAIVLAAWYILWMYQRTFTGPGVTSVEPVKDLDRREIGALAPLLVALVVFGFYPMPLLDVINPAATTILENVGVQDPAPTVGGTAQEADH